ncbi:MAG: PQQ-binding-like beta-propeller repeat protein [Pirellulales bacterium]|nr:PQQ-binding-like beta-propeller repeat protein [Pirellulales bacterium]
MVYGKRFAIDLKLDTFLITGDRMIRFILASALGLGLYVSTPVTAEDWPQFRGPTGSGTTRGAALPSEWSTDKNLAWKVKLPGTGLSQPVVVGDKLFVTAAVSDNLRKPKSFGQGVIETGREMLPDVEIDWQVVALDRNTGKTLWAKSATKGKPKHPVHACNSYATETPCADTERVYAYFGATGTLAAFDHTGNEVWKAELGVYPTAANWGSGSSPALGGGKVFVASFSNASGFVVGLDCKTGEEVWRFKWSDGGVTTYSSPLVWANSKRTELVVCGPDSVLGLDTNTGIELWRLSGFQPFTSSPTVDGDTLYFSNGSQSSGGPLFAIRAGASGDITTKVDQPSEFVAWNVTGGGAGWSSPLAYNGYLYVPGKGVLACYDAKTGKEQYKERLPNMNRLIASPVGTGDQVLVTNEDGSTAIIKAGPKFEVVGNGKLDDNFWSSPAVAGGDLYLRGVDHLYCVRQAKSK